MQILVLAAALPSAWASPAGEIPPIADHTEGMTHMEGFLDLYWDEASGHLFLEIPGFGQEILYQVSPASGLGSNPVGLDRGQLGGTRVLSAEPGPRSDPWPPTPRQ